MGLRWPTAIWSAVLGQAIRDIIVGPADFELRGMTAEEAIPFRKHIQAAAEAWVAEDANEPRRFVWVCEQIGLDPAAVRRALEEKE